MSNILNKSNHPVEVKKIHIRMWKLRHEIEEAIAKRIAEEGHATDQPVDIEDIKAYYTKILNADHHDSQDNDTGGQSEQPDDNLDSSGNPLDDDALAMMAALGGDESEADDEESSTDETESEDTPTEDESSSEMDDEAAAMAAQMLADQGMGTKPDESSKEEPAEGEEDDEAAMLAAQMLADQGGGSKEAQPEKEPVKKTREPFRRIPPKDEKIVEGFVLLSDINMDHIVSFSKGTFIHGQNIVIEFLVPKSFTQMVEVVNSIDIARKSKIISNSKPSFRLHSKFLFKFDNERGTLREFLQSIEPVIPDPPKKLKRPDTDDDDDDFDDLGF